MPWTSAVCASGSTSMTPVRPLTSRPGAVEAARARNRFVVRFARRTGAPAGMAAYDERSLATASSCCCQALDWMEPVVTPRNLLLLDFVGVAGVFRRRGGVRCPTILLPPHRPLPSEEYSVSTAAERDAIATLAE